MEAARQAVSDDVNRITELCRQGLAEVGPARGGALFVAREARAEPLDATLAEEIRDPDHCLVVGTLDGVVVGYVAARAEALRDGSVLAVVSDLYVEPEARGVAVGEALMNAVLSWARGRQCVGIDALALPGDRQTKNFFESHGFTARLLTMHHHLLAAAGDCSA